MTGPLDWRLREADIADDGRTEERTATASEREACAAALDILSCESLSARIEIMPASARRFLRLSGTIEADVTQACVVTLEPVPAHLAVTVDAECWPAGAVPAGSQADDGPDIEPMENGIIDLGRLVFEHLATALDPYPRKAGAEFDWKDPKAREDDSDHPFAALRRLKEEK